MPYSLGKSDLLRVRFFLRTSASSARADHAHRRGLKFHRLAYPGIRDAPETVAGSSTATRPRRTSLDRRQSEDDLRHDPNVELAAVLQWLSQAMHGSTGSSARTDVLSFQYPYCLHLAPVINRLDRKTLQDHLEGSTPPLLRGSLMAKRRW